MPTRNEIQETILLKKTSSQDDIRREYIKNLAQYTGRDTILYATAFTSQKVHSLPGAVLSVTLDDVQGFMSALHNLKNDKLDLLLHSPGGSMEAAEQIIQYLRAKYKHIRAVVPQNAMSAATMIACACDEIVMGKHSAIGPIDPQVTFPTATGLFTAPAQAILDEFEQAKVEVATNPLTAPLWVTKIQAYPPGFLNMCRATLDLARDKVTDWLSLYMFKGTPDNVAQGRTIADWLGNAKDHKTHGRPINIETARSKGLRVTALEKDQQLQELVLSTFHATAVTFDITHCAKIIENHNGKGMYLNLEPRQK